MTHAPLAGRTALVTGGASGIGRATARRLAADGAAVAVLDIDRPGADTVAAEIAAAGGKSVAVAADVSDGAAVRDAVGRARTALGPLHILVNNAGVCSFFPFDALEEA